MVEFGLTVLLNTERKPCPDFPVICKETVLLLHIERKKGVLEPKYYQGKGVTFTVKVGSYFDLSMEYFKECYCCCVGEL